MPLARRRLALAICLTSAAHAFAAAPAAAFQGDAARRAPRASVAHRLDALAREFVRAGKAPGVTVAVVRSGRDTLLLRGYGMADVENAVPATASTVYRVGSVTKQFTASAVMRLVERGRLSLDDTLGALLPGMPAAWRSVRLRQLLNHTSGIHSYTDAGARWRRRTGEDMPPDTILSLVTGDTLDFAPGTSWHYDNTGYVLLGMVLERVTGRRYAELLEAEFVKPLALPSVRYCDTAPLIPHRAHGYARDGERLINAPYLSMTHPFAAGALCATAGDLARWNRLLATGAVVSEQSYSRMTTAEGAAVDTRLTAVGAPRHYGYGLAVDTLAGHRMITHGGAINGFQSSNAYFPDDALSVTVLANQSSAPTNALMLEMARVALGADERTASPASRSP